MKNYAIMLAVTLFVAGCQSTGKDSAAEVPVNLDEEISLEQFCQNNPCRENILVTFRTENDVVDELLPLYWPAAQGDAISILPGEELLIEADLLEGDRLGNFRQVTAMQNPEKTIRFSFTQMDTSVGMMLSVQNPFSFPIKYNLDMIDFEGNPHQTSSCPVGGNMSVYEMWPHPIPELILSNMRVLAESAKSVCIY